MDPSVQKDVWWFLSQFWSTIMVALVIYTGGLVACRIVVAIWPQTADVVSGRAKRVDPTLPLVFRVWHATYLAHPFIVGALIGLVPDLPRPDFITSKTSAALWFGLAGLGNGQIHMLVDAFARQVSNSFSVIGPWVRQKLGMGSAPTPEATPTESKGLAEELEPEEREREK